MRPGRPRIFVLSTILCMSSWTAFGDEPESKPNIGPNSTRMDRSSGTASRLAKKQPPEAAARTQYNIGVRGADKGDELAAAAAREADAAKRAKLEAQSRDAYEEALDNMTRATRSNPRLLEAWQHAGDLNRKLGRFDAALAAYDRALSLKGGDAAIIESRGRTYLGLHRVEDAKSAYQSLLTGNRDLAARLLEAMRDYVGERRAAAGADAAQLDALAAWIGERSANAG